MNTSNQGQTPNYYGGNNNENGNSKRLLTLAAAAIAILLGLNIYFAVTKSKLSNQHETVVRQLDSKTDALNELNVQFDDATAQLEQERTTNAELSAKIDEQLAQLEKQKSKISGLIRNKGDLKAARKEIQAMLAQKDQYLGEIALLKEQVEQLTEANTTLTTEKEGLAQNLNETKTMLEEETTAKAALISEKTQLESTNKVLGKKVDIASAIRVSNVTVKSVAVKSSGKEKKKRRAKNIDKLNICFTTEANDVTDAGVETFYLRVVDPTGAPLAIETLGSGIASNKKSESDFRYTTTQEVNYTNSVTDVCGDWQPGTDFMKGKYLVEVYNKGYLVGTGEFKLK